MLPMLHRKHRPHEKLRMNRPAIWPIYTNEAQTIDCAIKSHHAAQKKRLKESGMHPLDHGSTAASHTHTSTADSTSFPNKTRCSKTPQHSSAKFCKEINLRQTLCPLSSTPAAAGGRERIFGFDSSIKPHCNFQNVFGDFLICFISIVLVLRSWKFISIKTKHSSADRKLAFVSPTATLHHHTLKVLEGGEVSRDID